MTEKLKQSRYNHFVKLGNGKRLAFNAMSCGLGEMDDKHYQMFVQLANGNKNNGDPKSKKLLKDLKKGGFLIPEDVDELDALRAGHYRARFGSQGFGLTIIPTLNCNFACDYCYEDKKIHSLPPDKGGLMSAEVCDNIVNLCGKEIAENSSFSVTWYGGEPLLACNVIGNLSERFIKICESKKSRYFAGMITNGYLLSKKNLDFLIKNKVTFLQVTIDGPKEVHDKRRPLKSGRGTYDRILSNLSHITKKTPMTVSIRINIDKRNQDNITGLLTDLKQRGFHQQKNFSTYFGHTVHYHNSCPDIASQCMATEEFSHFMIDANRMAIKMGFPVSVFPQLMIGSCAAVGSRGAVIEPKGRIQNCWNTVGRKDAETGELSPKGIGYNNNYIKWLGWTPFMDDCKSCDILPLCMGGCPYKSLYDKVGRTTSTRCSSWKYNLKSMLAVAKLAQDKNLLLLPPSRITKGGEE